MDTLAVSAFSLREQLGPFAIEFPVAGGGTDRFEVDHPRDLAISDLPARMRDYFGISTIEVVGFQFAGPEDPMIEQFVESVQAAGITLLNVALDVGDLQRSDPERRMQDIAQIKRWVDQFADLAPRFIRTRANWPSENGYSPAPPAQLVDSIAELSEYVERRGSRLLLENLGGASSDPDWVRRLIVDTDKRVGMLLDLGNFDELKALRGRSEHVDADQDSAEPVDWSAVYSRIDQLGQLAELVHVKVLSVSDDGAIGPIDLPHALDLLHTHGYAGPLTVEYEGHGGDAWQKTAQVLEAIRRHPLCGTATPASIGSGTTTSRVSCATNV